MGDSSNIANSNNNNDLKRKNSSGNSMEACLPKEVFANTYNHPSPANNLRMSFSSADLDNVRRTASYDREVPFGVISNGAVAANEDVSRNSTLTEAQTLNADVDYKNFTETFKKVIEPIFKAFPDDALMNTNLCSLQKAITKAVKESVYGLVKKKDSKLKAIRDEAVRKATEYQESMGVPEVDCAVCQESEFSVVIKATRCCAGPVCVGCTAKITETNKCFKCPLCRKSDSKIKHQAGEPIQGVITYRPDPLRSTQLSIPLRQTTAQEINLGNHRLVDLHFSHALEREYWRQFVAPHLGASVAHRTLHPLTQGDISRATTDGSDDEDEPVSDVDFGQFLNFMNTVVAARPQQN